MATAEPLMITAAALAAVGLGAVAVARRLPGPGPWRSRLYPTVVTAAAAATIVAEVISWVRPALTPVLVLSAAAVLLSIAGCRRLRAQREFLRTFRRDLAEVERRGPRSGRR